MVALEHLARTLTHSAGMRAHTYTAAAAAAATRSVFERGDGVFGDFSGGFHAAKRSSCSRGIQAKPGERQGGRPIDRRVAGDMSLRWWWCYCFSRGCPANSRVCICLYSTTTTRYWWRDGVVLAARARESVCCAVASATARRSGVLLLVGGRTRFSCGAMQYTWGG